MDYKIVSPHTNELISQVKALPGISIRKCRHGDLIYADTEYATYEIEVLDPSERTIRLCSTDKLLHTPKIGLFVQSVLDDSDIGVSGWIKRGLRMQVRFRDTTFQSSLVQAARIRGTNSRGERFHYDVF